MALEGKSLQERFIVPPLSILDTQQGYWRDRKIAWEKEQAISVCETRESSLGMGLEFAYADIYKATRARRAQLGISFREYLDKYVSEEEKAKIEDRTGTGNGVSLFDPVLAEIIATWFTPIQHAKIFDPMAGDTRKGGVFAMLGHDFTGIELRQEQVNSNNEYISKATLPDGVNVRYICDDGRNVAKHIDIESQDLLMCCPPYYDLEVYSDDPRDASNQKSYSDFLSILKDALSKAWTCLRKNRFAVIVVGDVRGKNGAYYGLPQDVVEMFQSFGAALINEIILAEAIGRKPVGAPKSMANRKVMKRHQQVLVFYKGDPRDVSKHFIDVESRTDIPKVINGRLHFPWRGEVKTNAGQQLGIDFRL